MTGFDGLLPGRRPVPPLPPRGGPGAVREAATQRRHRRAHRVAAGLGAACFAAGGLALLRPPAGDIAIVVPPVPRETATPSPAPDRRPAPAAADPRRAPADAVRVSVAPRGSGAPAPAARLVPTSLAPSPAPPPSAAGSRFTRIDRTVVPHVAGSTCEMKTPKQDPGGGLCGRYLGPLTAVRGRPVDLTFEYCAPVVDVTVRFPQRREIMFALGRAPTDWFWMGIAPPGGPAHDVVVVRGTCLRYVAHWNGLLRDGSLPQAGEHEVDTWLQDGMERSWVNEYFALTITE